MALPSNYNSGSLNVKPWIWVEIAGIPECYGNFSASSDIFSTRTVSESFDRVKPLLSVLGSFSQEIDPLEGKSSVSSMNFAIVDREHDLAQKLGLASDRNDQINVLSADISETVNTINIVGGGAYLTEYLTTGGIFYVGNETVIYTSRTLGKFEGCTRGAYGSTAKQHSAGTPLTHYPRSLAQRPTTVRLFLSSSQPSESVEVEADSIIRQRGFVTNALYDEGGTSVEINIESIDRRMSGGLVSGRKKKLFDKKFISTLQYGINIPGDTRLTWKKESDDDVLGNSATLFVKEEDFEDYFQSNNLEGTLAKYNDDRSRGYTFFVRVNDEYMCIQAQVVPYEDGKASFQILQRGCFGSIINNHHVGATVSEIFPIFGASNDANYSDAEYIEYYLPYTYKTPIRQVLQFLTSTGTGTNGAYDDFPADWSLAVPVEYIDVDECLFIEDQNISTYVAGIIDKEIDLPEYIAKEYYKPFKLFPVTKLNGLYTIRKISPILGSGTYDIFFKGTIDERHLIDIPTLDANLESVVGKYTLKYDKDIDDEFKTINVIKFPDTDELYDGVYGEIIEESSLIRSVSGRVKLRFPTDSTSGASTFANDQLVWWQSWYSRPASIINFKTTFEKHVIEPGDSILLTSANIMNQTTGEMGCTNIPVFIIQKSIDDVNGEISFIGQMFYRSNLRRVNPSGLITTVSGNDLTIEDGSAISTGYSNGFAARNDADVNWFNVGDKVQISDYQLKNISTATISAINGNVITISGLSGPLTPASNSYHVISSQVYDSATATQTSNFAYLADVNRKLGTSDVDAHIYVP